MILLDLFCGRWGWSRAFAKRGWKCIGVDLTEPPETPEGCFFSQADVLTMRWFEDSFYTLGEDFKVDAIVASPPCEEFSVHGMKHFHPNPKYPANGIRLFEYTRALCEASGLPYVIENVRTAQQFVGTAKHHCGPFYLWGNAVPQLMPQGIQKGSSRGRNNKNATAEQLKSWRQKNSIYRQGDRVPTYEQATIPPELANTVAEFMERTLEKHEVNA